MSDRMTSPNDAIAAAEEVLRVIYGDDLMQCPVRPATIAPIIERTIELQTSGQGKVLEVYEQLIEAVHRFSTPPEMAGTMDPAEFRRLLSERLDGIHELTTKMLNATELLRNLPSSKGDLG